MKRHHSISFQSPIPAIDELRFYALPRENALEIHKIARHSDTTVYQDKEGKLYSPGVNFSGCFVFGRGRSDGYVICAAKLGLVTHEAARRHLRLAKEHDDRKEQRDRAQRFVESAHRLGIKLTAAQVKKLNQLRK